MKDYSKMSDFELNVQVAESEGVNWYCPASCSPTGGWEYCGVGKLMLKDDAQLPDYCNNPSDAWPIIKTNHINIGWAGDEEWFARTVHTEKVFDVNPLRAAMIVYLMMKDEEQ